jgi:O-antigen/teichoic acid export membrane protein
MKSELKSLGKETVIYGLSTIVARLLNFLLLPFYTHFLEPSELGVVATVFAYIAFLNIVFQYGFDQAYLRFAAGRDEEEKSVVFSTCQGALAITSLAFGGTLYLFAESLAVPIGLRVEHAPLLRYAAFILSLDALAIVPFASLRLHHRAWTYVGVKSLNIASNVVLNILLIGGFGLGVRGVFGAALFAAAFTFFLLAAEMSRWIQPRLSVERLKLMLRFSLPLVPAGIGAMMVQVIDRPLMLHLTDEATVGVYQANYRLGIFMLLVVNMFDQAWRPFFLERADQTGSSALFGRVLTLFTAGAGWVALGLALFLPDAVRLSINGYHLINPRYWGGIPVIPVILAAYVLHGMYVNFLASVTISKRTDLLVWITGLGAVVNIGTNFLLIPRIGMMGAAWATLLSYGSMAFALWALGRRVYPIPYEYGRLAGVAASLAAGIVVARFSWGIAGVESLLIRAAALVVPVFGFLGVFRNYFSAAPSQHA